MLAHTLHTLALKSKGELRMPTSHCESLQGTPKLVPYQSLFPARRGICTAVIVPAQHQGKLFSPLRMKQVLKPLVHSRLARLVVGPFWAWNCTGGGPSVHWKEDGGKAEHKVKTLIAQG